MAVAGAAIALVTLVTGAYSAVQWIQFVMATLSVTGSSSIIAYAVFQNTVRSPEVRPLFYLSLSDLFLGVCWLAGALLYSMQTTNQDIICYNLQAAGQIFYMASFLYTINYTWHLYMDLKVKYSQTLHRMSSLVLDYGSCLGRTATILCSLIPFLLMVPVFCLGNGSDCYGNFSQKHGCLLMHTEINKPTGQLQPVGGSLCSVIYLYGIGIFLISFWVSFITILVLLIQARGLYKRYVNSSGFLGNQQWAVIKMVEQRVVFYPIAYFCCWGPAVLLGIMKLTVSENSRLYMALYILQALTAASQGLLNCIVYGWTQNAFQSMKRKACRDVDTQTPLLRSQKKFYASVPNPSTQAVAVSTSTVL
ncbi:transmembrane protein 116 isoform X1 [Alligator sinensis]|uniref:Transmembrane protein 116 isoform X1 n=2 Tax=Alligator sinensis TaxID=38654 RepID=A0A1U7R897_ALLSI|nr:transmembrane protein 116 isoform X1 [Alligator sinensis]